MLGGNVAFLRFFGKSFSYALWHPPFKAQRKPFRQRLFKNFGAILRDFWLHSLPPFRDTFHFSPSESPLHSVLAQIRIHNCKLFWTYVCCYLGFFRVEIPGQTQSWKKSAFLKICLSYFSSFWNALHNDRSKIKYLNFGS